MSDLLWAKVFPQLVNSLVLTVCLSLSLSECCLDKSSERKSSRVYLLLGCASFLVDSSLPTGHNCSPLQLHLRRRQMICLHPLCQMLPSQLTQHYQKMKEEEDQYNRDNVSSVRVSLSRSPIRSIRRSDIGSHVCPSNSNSQTGLHRYAGISSPPSHFGSLIIFACALFSPIYFSVLYLR